MAIQTVDLGPVKGPKGDKGDTGVVDANTPITYSESTADSPPATGSKLGLIVGWCVGKIKALTTNVSSLNSKTSKLVLDNVNGMTFGYDSSNGIFYMQFYFADNDIYRLGFGAQTQVIALDYYNGTSWTTLWTK